MDEFLAVFGDITVATLVQWALALGFLIMILKKVKKYLDEKIKTEHETREQMKIILAAVEKINSIEQRLEKNKKAVKFPMPQRINFAAF